VQAVRHWDSCRVIPDAPSWKSGHDDKDDFAFSEEKKAAKKDRRSVNDVSIGR